MLRHSYKKGNSNVTMNRISNICKEVENKFENDNQLKGNETFFSRNCFSIGTFKNEERAIEFIFKYFYSCYKNNKYSQHYRIVCNINQYRRG